MGQFKGAKPAGQPRSLRTRAQDASDAKSFPNDLSFNYQQGAPESVVGTAQYEDGAKAAAPRAAKQPNSAEPKPIRKRGSK